MIMRDIFGDLAETSVKVYEPYIDQLYILSSIEQIVLFQKSASENEFSDKLNDLNSMKGYCDATAVSATSAVKIGNRFYTAQITNSINGELLTPMFTQRPEPEIIEHTVVCKLGSVSDDWDLLCSVAQSFDIPLYVIIEPDSFDAKDETFDSALKRLQHAGIKTLGYIDGKTGVDTLLYKWATWYMPDGIYFDSVDTDDTFYSAAVASGKSYGFHFFIGNTGTPPDQGFYDIFDVIVSSGTYDSEIESTLQGSVTEDVTDDYYYLVQESFDINSIKSIFGAIIDYYAGTVTTIEDVVQVFGIRSTSLGEEPKYTVFGESGRIFGG